MAGYGGVPEGPLSAYLGVRQANEQAGLQGIQGATQMQGLLAKMQAEQRAKEFQAKVATAKTPEERLAIAHEFMGPDALGKSLQSSQDRQAQIGATKEATAGRLQQQAGQLEMQNQFNTQRIAQMQDETARKRESDAWQKQYQTQQLDIQKQLADMKATQAAQGAGLAGESAGKISMADQAVMDIRDTRAILFDKDGKLRRDIVAAMNVPFTAGLPGHTDARSAYSKIHNAVAAKLRIETGAAATESETKGILDRFLPKISDPEPVVKERLDRLEEFMNTTIDQTKGVRIDQLRSRQKKAEPAAPAYPTATNAAGEKLIFKDGAWQKP